MMTREGDRETKLKGLYCTMSNEAAMPLMNMQLHVKEQIILEYVTADEIQQDKRICNINVSNKVNTDTHHVVTYRWGRELPACSHV